MSLGALVHRKVARTLMVIMGIALLTGAIVVLALYASPDLSCASPPTQQQRAQQEAFVEAHLPDARDFEWTVMDCDDNGEAYVDFTTGLRGSAASQAFLEDANCQTSKETDNPPGDVVCSSGDTEVFIHFEDHGGIDTYGTATASV